VNKFIFFIYSAAVFASLIYFNEKVDAQSFQCPSNPQIGTRCTQRVTIRLRKVESEGRDEFNQRFEPEAGWVVEDCDTRSGERKRTGEASGPSCVKVQAGNALTSTSFVDTQVRQLAEHMEKLKIQFGKLPIFADIESRARNEFSAVQRSLQSTQTSNPGVNISAWVAVRGGCKTRSPFGCINWGPGGSLDTDVIVRLRYVGTNQDVSRLLEKYVAEANKAAQTSGGSNPSNSACVSVDSRSGWQHFNLPGSFTRVASISGGWSVDTRNYASVGSSGHSGRDAEALAPYNQYKFDQRFPFGALLMGSGQGTLWIQNPVSFNGSFGAVDMRINDADNALGDNGGSLQVCFGN
jgi:hypothetical protein